MNSINGRTEIVEAWHKGITEGSRNSFAREKLLNSGDNLFLQFEDHYKKLRALPRRTRRTIQRKWKHSLAGVALLLALGLSPAMGATINVTPGAVDNMVNGNCSIVEAITAANTNAAVDTCTAGNDLPSGADTINLDGSTFTLNQVNNNFYGNNGLPVITSEIVIEGNGSTIQRSGAGGTPAFRIIAIDGDTGNGDLTLNETTISGGLAGSGGGIYNYYGILTITNSTISGNNTNSGSGGGILNSGPLTITNSTISGNVANSNGGGILNVDTATITNSNISGNYADNGAGISNVGGTAEITITNSTISGNMGSFQNGEGGGIYNNNGTLTITNSTISGNIVAGQAGEGGGIFTYSDNNNVTITNSTISGNYADDGAGIFNDGLTTIINSTISGNNANDRGGGIFSFGIEVTIMNSIVSGNTDNNGGSEIYSNGGIYADSFNIFGHAALTNAQAFENFLPTVPTDINATSDDQNISLVNIINTTLADNGGPTLTHDLPANSPAIDAGEEAVCGAAPVNGIDQRNFLRDDGFCDIGAYEAQPTASVTITKQTSPPGRAGFDFTSTGFPDGCEIEDMFTLDDGDALNCIVPAGDYTVTETPLPALENTLNILCSALPSGAATDNSTGELTFTIADNGDNVNCRFINLVPSTLFDVSDEPAGANCANGGVRIDEGLDANGDGILQIAEINNTSFVCNGSDGTDGLNVLTNVTPELPGANCANGGNRIDTGIDDDGSGTLEMGEIDNTFYVCNGAQGTPGTPGNDGEDSGGDGCGSLAGEVNTASAISNLLLTLIPAVVGFAGLFWRRRY